MSSNRVGVWWWRAILLLLLLLVAAVRKSDAFTTTSQTFAGGRSRLRLTTTTTTTTTTISTTALQERVGIVGAGAIAMGTAALLQLEGKEAATKEGEDHHGVMLWSPSGRSLSEDFVMTMSGSDETQQQLVEQRPFTCRIATSAKELVTENDVIIIALPANGHKKVFDAIAPHLLEENRHHVIISSHASMGALYLSKLLSQDGSDFFNIPITAWGTTVCTARQQDDSPQTVKINTIRKSVDICTIPGGGNKGNNENEIKGRQLCERLFPSIQFQTRPGLLAITLSNLNPQNHLGIALGNISRMDKGEHWYQSQHITPTIGKYLQDLDNERLAIAGALGLPVKTIYEHFSWSFHVPIVEGDISEMNQQIHRKGNDVYGPDSTESRYVTEDVPFGLPLIIVLGELVGRPATLHRAGLQIMSSMYGRDFWAENDLLESLQVEQWTLEQLQHAASTGTTTTTTSTTASHAAPTAPITNGLEKEVPSPS